MLFPSKKIILLVISFIGVFAAFFLRGGKRMDSIIGIKACVIIYWIVNLCLLVACIIWTLFIKKLIADKEKEKEDNSFNFVKYGIQLSPSIIY